MGYFCPLVLVFLQEAFEAVTCHKILHLHKVQYIHIEHFRKNTFSRNFKQRRCPHQRVFILKLC